MSEPEDTAAAFAWCNFAAGRLPNSCRRTLAAAPRHKATAYTTA